MNAESSDDARAAFLCDVLIRSLVVGKEDLVRVREAGPAEILEFKRRGRVKCADQLDMALDDVRRDKKSKRTKKGEHA